MGVALKEKINGEYAARDFFRQKRAGAMNKARRKEEQPEGPAMCGTIMSRTGCCQPGWRQAGWSRLTVYEKAFRLRQLQCKDAGDARAEEAARTDRLLRRGRRRGLADMQRQLPQRAGWMKCARAAGRRAALSITSAMPRISGGERSRRWYARLADLAGASAARTAPWRNGAGDQPGYKKKKFSTLRPFARRWMH